MKHINYHNGQDSLLSATIKSGISGSMLESFILSKNMAILDTRDINTDTPLITAIKAENLEAYLALGDALPDLLLTSNKSQLYPIQLAVCFFKDEHAKQVINIFVKNNIKLTTEKSNKLSPLVISCGLFKPKFTYYLLKYGIKAEKSVIAESLNFGISVGNELSIINLLVMLRYDDETTPAVFNNIFNKIISELTKLDHHSAAFRIKNYFNQLSDNRSSNPDENLVFPENVIDTGYYILSGDDIFARASIEAGTKHLSTLVDTEINNITYIGLDDFDINEDEENSQETNKVSNNERNIPNKEEEGSTYVGYCSVIQYKFF
ncbi:MAG: hypothetical protein MHPSP_000187 [Paramarteilia canceri]